MWGWPDLTRFWPSGVDVFPTGVGMARGRENQRCTYESVPHGCGDGPQGNSAPVEWSECSPRVWGWPGLNVKDVVDKNVFPTGVGMARVKALVESGMSCVPHGCGDGPP